MLENDIQLILLQFVVEEITQALTENPLIRNTLDFGSVTADNPSEPGDPDFLNFRVA